VVWGAWVGKRGWVGHGRFSLCWPSLGAFPSSRSRPAVFRLPIPGRGPLCRAIPAEPLPAGPLPAEPSLGRLRRACPSPRLPAAPSRRAFPLRLPAAPSRCAFPLRLPTAPFRRALPRRAIFGRLRRASSSPPLLRVVSSFLFFLAISSSSFHCAFQPSPGPARFSLAAPNSRPPFAFLPLVFSSLPSHRAFPLSPSGQASPCRAFFGRLRRASSSPCLLRAVPLVSVSPRLVLLLPLWPPRPSRGSSASAGAFPLASCHPPTACLSQASQPRRAATVVLWGVSGWCTFGGLGTLWTPATPSPSTWTTRPPRPGSRVTTSSGSFGPCSGRRPAPISVAGGLSGPRTFLCTPTSPSPRSACWSASPAWGRFPGGFGSWWGVRPLSTGGGRLPRRYPAAFSWHGLGL
jgi:hypothetical protein